MTIADHPLHGSGRAALPHPALALGGEREALAPSPYDSFIRNTSPV